MADEQQQSNINANYKVSRIGMNLDSSVTQLEQGYLSYSLNAIIENFDGNKVNYTNEQANRICSYMPAGYTVIGVKNIIEENIILFWLVNEDTKDSEIGKVVDCTYSKLINSKCLGFDINHPIIKIVYRKTNCGLEVYWVDGLNRIRYIDLFNLPFKEVKNGCDTDVTTEVDCNKLSIQPQFSIPQIDVSTIYNEGELVAGDYQFSVQYANALSEAYTSFYSVTNPVPIFDPNKVTADFNYTVSKSIALDITNIDTTGIYDYINVAVIKTINNISSVNLVGTFQITKDNLQITYTGQNKSEIQLDVNDIFQKYEIYDTANDLTTAQDVLIPSQLTTAERISYQEIANQITLKWQTYRFRGDKFYLNPVNVEKYRGYMRDEVVPYEIVLLTKNGQQTDGFHIPGRKSISSDTVRILNNDVVREGDKCSPIESQPKWKVYNTGSVGGNNINIQSTTICHEEIIPGSSSQDLAGTMTLTCSDEGCTQEGFTGIIFNFNKPLPADLQLLFGYVQNTAIGLKHVGSDIFVPPVGSTPDTFYPDPSIPFVVNIPQGSSSFTIPSDVGHIYQQGHDGDAFYKWTCHTCLTPITYLFISGDNTDFDIGWSLTNNGIAFQDNTPPINITPPSTITVCEEVIDDCYEGPYQFGEFAYWESTELYPCNAIYGELSNTPIRHHKFPDNLITPHFSKDGYIYPIGVNIDVQQVVDLIKASSLTQEQKDNIQGFKIVRGNVANNKSVVAKGIVRNVGKYDRDEQTYYFPNYPYNDLREDPFISVIQTANDTGASNQMSAFTTDESKERYVFNSPDTSFFQPSLGSKLKIESLLTGTAKSHFASVQKHSQYKFLSTGAYVAALGVGIAIGVASATVGSFIFSSVNIFNGTAAFTAYQVFVDILTQTCPKINYAYQYNSLGVYDDQTAVPNDGNKVREIDIATYLIPGMQSVGDTYVVNNFERESSVYIKTNTTLPFPELQDTSRFINSQSNCNSTILENPISLYYATIKNDFLNQYGQLYSYETIDTGFQRVIDLNSSDYQIETIFGGDTFINKFGFKTKIPFFIDNRVGFPDEADIDYRDFGNIAYPTYWFSADTDAGDFHILGININVPLIPRKINNFDCDVHPIFFQKGKIYLFAYGVPYFYAESRVNVDMRQAYNGQEGDFFPHVSSDIPDSWFQEVNTSIKFDNTYTYNITYSKQNKENLFSHLPDDFTNNSCREVFPWRAIFSEKKTDSPNPSLRNNWLIYKPVSVFDFPQNYGHLISLDGIEDRQVLARFENKTLLYNALLTAPTSAADVYLGQTLFSSQVPPLDYADTDGGYIGTQHKLLLKTEYGHITCDSKRGQVFVLNGQQAREITNENVSKFFTQFLNFSIQDAFPEINIDNHFGGIGLHGVFDPKYNRLILTKLDYELIDSSVVYDSTNNSFSKNGMNVKLTDSRYFCNRSFTISYAFDYKSWVSFHSYLPNFYIPEANFFYSGINNEHSSVWEHDVSITNFNNFYGEIVPYIIEVPNSYNFQDELLQNIKDYSRVLQYTDFFEWVETDDDYFNKLILFNSQQSSGVLKLVKKPKNNLSQYSTYPIYETDSKTITFTKSNSFYNINTFWSVTTSPKKPIWIKSCKSLSEPKQLNQDNCNYGKRSYHKAPLMAKNLFIRWILDDRDDIKIISQFSVSPSQISYK